MPSLASLMEVKVIGAIKSIQTIQNVLGCMRVYDIEKDDDTHSVGSINKFSKLLRCAISRTCGKEAGNLVSERLKITVDRSPEEIKM